MRHKLVQVMSWNKKYDQAMKEYEKILKQLPNNVDALLGMALTYGNKNDHISAIALLKKAYPHPVSPSPRFSFAEGSFYAGQLADSWRVGWEILKNHPQHQPTLLLKA